MDTWKPQAALLAAYRPVQDIENPTVTGHAPYPKNVLASVDSCEDCGAALAHEGGCAYCRICGWSRCAL